jgi:hypothetical protein
MAWLLLLYVGLRQTYQRQPVTCAEIHGVAMVRAVLTCLVIFGVVGQVCAAPEPTIAGSDLVGTYSCAGTNPDGKTYEGIVDIVKMKDTYLVRWTMQDDSQVVGVGIFAGGMLSVSYFGGTPSVVVYSIGENGRLDGQWTAGGAEGEIFKETLTKMPEGAPKPAKPTKRDARPRSRVTV